MEAKQVIEKMVNLWFREANSLRSVEDRQEEISFISDLESEFPDLKFTFSTQTQEIILLTEV